MRWKINIPRSMDEKIIMKFAILPICIKGEIRWLERVIIKCHYYHGWHLDEFVD